VAEVVEAEAEREHSQSVPDPKFVIIIITLYARIFAILDIPSRDFSRA